MADLGILATFTTIFGIALLSIGAMFIVAVLVGHHLDAVSKDYPAPDDSEHSDRVGLSPVLSYAREQEVKAARARARHARRDERVRFSHDDRLQRGE